MIRVTVEATALLGASARPEGFDGVCSDQDVCRASPAVLRAVASALEVLDRYGRLGEPAPGDRPPV